MDRLNIVRLNRLGLRSYSLLFYILVSTFSCCHFCSRHSRDLYNNIIISFSTIIKYLKLIN